MAAITAEELRILVRAETKAARAELNRFRTTTKSTTTDLKSMAKQLLGPLSVAAGIGMITKAAVNFIKTGVKFNMELEQLSVSFETILGSASAAADMMEQLTEFSASTPLQLAGIADGAKRLIAFGTAAEDVVDTMRNLGNAAMGNQATLDRLVNAYGKVQAKGKASLEELNMFTEAGVPLMAELGKNLGLTNEELFKFVSSGKVGFTEVNAALESLTTGEGQFAGLLEKQSETLAGATSTMKDNMSLLKAEILEGLTPALTDGAKSLSEHARLMRESIGAANAYMRVLAGAAFEVDSLALAEQKAYTAQRIRDAQEAIGGLERKLEERTGKSFAGGILSAWDWAMKGLTGIEKDRNADLIDQLRYLDIIVQRETERLALIEDQIVKERKVNEVSIPGAGTAGSGAGAISDAEFGALPEMVFKPPVIVGLSTFTGLMSDLDFVMVRAAEDMQMTAAIADNELLPALEFPLPFIDGMVRASLGFTALDEAFVNSATSAKQATEAMTAYDKAFAEARNVSVFNEALDRLVASQNQVIEKNIEVAAAFQFMGAIALGSLDSIAEGMRKLADEEMANMEEEIANIKAGLKDAFESALISSTINMFSDLGSALVEAGEGAMTAKDAMANFISSLVAALPQLMLQAGLAILSINPADPVGWALVIGSGLLALFSGAFNSSMNRDGSSSTDDIPSAGLVTATKSFTGDTVTVIQGDVLVKDLREAEAIGATAAAAGHR